MKSMIKDKKTKDFIVLVFAIISNIVFLFLLWTLKDYSSLNKIIFILINIAVLALLGIINGLAYLQFTNKKRDYFRLVIILNIVFLILGVIAGFYGYRVNSAINDVISGDKVETENVTMAFAYNKDKNNIQKAEDFAGKKIGILSENLFGELYNLSKQELASVNVEYKDYQSYQDIVLAILNDEIDGGILPQNYKYMFKENEDDEDYMSSLETAFEFSNKVDIEGISGSEIDVTKEPFNVLLIGMDETHSDVVMVATFNPIAMRVTYTSIPRDSFVPICGNSKQKLAHSRNYGRACTIQTVEDLMDIDIDFFFETNFEGVVDMVNAIGGIPIDSPITFVGQTPSHNRGTYTVKIFQGLHRLNGDQALAYARERHAFADGDFQRQKNQQQVITSFANELMNTKDINAVLKVLDAAGKNVRTNMPKDTIIDLFNLVLKKIDNSYEKDFSCIDIDSTSIAGYPSHQYDEGLEFILWIYKPFLGSLSENREFILRNTDLLDQKIVAPEPIRWSCNWEYRKPVLWHSYFDEEQIHEPIPDLVGDWSGKNISELNEWTAKNNITLNVTEIIEGMEGYDPNMANGTIVSQDAPATRMVKKITTLSVTIIKQIPKVPDFSKIKLSELNNIDWVSEYGFTLKVGYIKSLDENGAPNKDYDINLRGGFASQSVEAGTLCKEEIKEVIVYYYDFPYVNVALPARGSTIDQVKTWVKTNLVDNSVEDAIIYKEYEFSDEAQMSLDGKVYEIKPVLNDEPYLKSSGQIVVTLYKYVEEATITLPNFIGMDKNEFVNYMNQYGVNFSASEDLGVTGQTSTITKALLGDTPLSGLTIKPSKLKGQTVTYSYSKVASPESNGNGGENSVPPAVEAR